MAETGDLSNFRDTKAIADELGLWCRIVDTRSLERMPEVFAQDIHWDFGKGTADEGLDLVIARIRAHLVDQVLCGPTQHQLANTRIDIDGDQAESEAYFLAAHAGIGPYAGKTLLQWGNYLDSWRRTDDGWRIVKRVYRIDISDGPLEIVYGNDTGHLWQDGDNRKIDR
ncbi:MAG: nuclear transport factor 2 family protein [Rhodobiaceae bacterium]|nr:nuclear transport factor 2 family protein [Novosphingobium sp.]MCC0057615.1 nuclear transport factor 2 family protein [Rhodobiaceae bacterium]